MELKAPAATLMSNSSPPRFPEPGSFCMMHCGDLDLAPLHVLPQGLAGYVR